LNLIWPLKSLIQKVQKTNINSSSPWLKIKIHLIHKMWFFALGFTATIHPLCNLGKFWIWISVGRSLTMDDQGNIKPWTSIWIHLSRRYDGPSPSRLSQEGLVVRALHLKHHHYNKALFYILSTLWRCWVHGLSLCLRLTLIIHQWFIWLPKFTIRNKIFYHEVFCYLKINCKKRIILEQFN